MYSFQYSLMEDFDDCSFFLYFLGLCQKKKKEKRKKAIFRTKFWCCWHTNSFLHASCLEESQIENLFLACHSLCFRFFFSWPSHKSTSYFSYHVVFHIFAFLILQCSISSLNYGVIYIIWKEVFEHLNHA